MFVNEFELSQRMKPEKVYSELLKSEGLDPGILDRENTTRKGVRSVFDLKAFLARLQ